MPFDIGHVVYEIHLHPTYRVPCLWFSLQGLPQDEPAFNIDTVFRHLVPDQFKDALRGSGVGGISGDVGSLLLPLVVNFGISVTLKGRLD